MPLILKAYGGTSPTDDVTLNARELTRNIKSKKVLQEILDEDHLIQPLGRVDSEIILMGVIYSTTGTEYGKMEAWGDFVEVVTGTDYVEFPTSSKWFVDKISLRREGGNVNIFTWSLTLIRDWS